MELAPFLLHFTDTWVKKQLWQCLTSDGLPATCRQEDSWNNRHSIHLWPHIDVFLRLQTLTATCPCRPETHPGSSLSQSCRRLIGTHMCPCFSYYVCSFKEFVGHGAIMHYNSYVPELDLKPVQFECNHQVSIFITHIPTLKQQTAYVTYLQTNVWWVQ